MPQYCKPNVQIKNHAISGRSSKSFREEGYWEPVINGIKKDDYLLIIFGHNDQKKKKPLIYAEAKSDYYNNLIRYIKEAKSKGGKPILITSMCRRVFNKNGLKHSLGEYPKYCRLAAKEEDIPLIDLNAISFSKIKIMSKEESKKLYNHISKDSKYSYWTNKIKDNKDSYIDNSHLNMNGAAQVAGWLVDDAKKQELKFGELFK